MINIWCKNDGKRHQVELGTTLGEMAAKWHIKGPVLAALVDHELKDLSYQVIVSQEVEFLDYGAADGRRCYIRSLCFVLQAVVRELYPDKILAIHHSLPSGLYCELLEPFKAEDGRRPVLFLTDEEIETIRQKMQKIIDDDIPFTKKRMLAEEAEAIFDGQNQPHKAALLRSTGVFTTNVYYLGKTADSFHGPLVPSSGLLQTFGLVGFNQGMCLQLPQMADSGRLMPIRRQSKIAASLKEYSDWCDIEGVRGIGNLNKAIDEGRAVQLINLAEALHERKYAAIADQIWQRRGEVKIVFIAGPSSSGKTSTSLRLALQCKVLGLNPKVLELDNYFHNREDTPKDENGNYDFEALGAMDLELLGTQLNDLLAGKEVEIPKFDFKAGCRRYEGKKLRLEEKDILIMEGIHALNPEMVPGVDQTRIFRVYASALTSLSIDENNNISTSDNRLLRRMIRDNRVRGISPEDTILRWSSVRRGEIRGIFPFQENADAIFNSALVFELPLLKYYAEPLLRRISQASPAYPEAVRLLKFLSYIFPLRPDEIAAIPPTSIMREFIGGQTL